MQRSHHLTLVAWLSVCLFSGWIAPGPSDPLPRAGYPGLARQQPRVDIATLPEFTGYSGQISYFQGDDIDFHVSSPVANNAYQLFIYREGASRQLVHVQASEGPATVNAALADAEYGFEWPATATVPGNVTAAWPSGYYLARLEEAAVVNPPPLDAWDEVIPFLIKPAAPASKILVQFPTNTWLAYDDRFGRSPYTEPRTFHTSFHRPMKRYLKWIEGATGETVSDIEGYYLRWLEQNGYQVDVIANSDIVDSSILNPGNYRLFISVGHDEYWSKPMRNTLQAFIEGGGNVLFWSSNSIYYQVRFEDDRDTMLSYKLTSYASQHDPLWGVDDSLVTTHWALPPVNLPPTSLVGLSYHYGGVGVGGYAVYRTNDWAFQGAGLHDGAVIGNYPAIGDDILAQEVDATYYGWSGGRPAPVNTAQTGTPANFTILGVQASPQSAPAVMGYYEDDQGATVFHAGTWDWWKGLFLNDPALVRITHNLLARLTQGEVSPAPIARPGSSVAVFRNGLNGYSGAEDTYLDADNPATNFATAPTLDLAHNRNGDKLAALIKFDVSSLPAAAEIISAQLVLYPLSLQSGSELKVSRLAPSSQWQADQATWSQAADQVSWPGGSATQGASQENEFIRAAQRAIGFEVAEQLRAWQADPASNRGLALRGYTAYDQNYGYTRLGFASSENKDSALRPRLIVRYACALPGDVNGDQRVDFVDVQGVADHWNGRQSDPSSGYDARYDLNHDGAVDIADVQQTAGQWGQEC